jgi:hypothetical protein
VSAPFDRQHRRIRVAWRPDDGARRSTPGGERVRAGRVAEEDRLTFFACGPDGGSVQLQHQIAHAELGQRAADQLAADAKPEHDDMSGQFRYGARV